MYLLLVSKSVMASLTRSVVTSQGLMMIAIPLSRMRTALSMASKAVGMIRTGTAWYMASYTPFRPPCSMAALFRGCPVRFSI